MTAHVESGFGRSIVFLPPLGGTAAMFEGQLPEFSRDHRAIAVTPLGNGDTAPLDTDVGDVVRAQTNDIVRLLDKLSVPRAHFVGVGYGGALAQQMAFEHPGRVRSLVLCDTWGDATPQTLADHVLAVLYKATLLSYRLPRRALVMATLNTYARWPAAGKILADAMRTARLPELALQHEAYGEVRNSSRLRNVEAPTLCLAGDAAPWLVSRARRLSLTVPDATIGFIKNSFEPSNLCQPALFNAAVREFLDAREHSD